MSAAPLRIDNAGGRATRRLVTLFSGATDEELAHGLSWYALAHDTAAALAEPYRGYITTDTAAGVIAALSPRSSWPQNVERARQLLATGDTYGLTLGRGKARRIVAGEAPLAVLSGPKERSFYSNVSDPLGSDAVTIDAHAFDAAAGMVTSDPARKALGRVGEYERVAAMYRSAARTLGVAPHVVQAVVWVVWRNRFGAFHYQRVAA